MGLELNQFVSGSGPILQSIVPDPDQVLTWNLFHGSMVPDPAPTDIKGSGSGSGSGSGIGYRKLLTNRSFTVLLQFHQLLLLLQSFSSSTSTAATYTSTLDEQSSPPPELLRRWQQPPELLLAVAIGPLLLGHLLIHDRPHDAFPEATDKEAMLKCELVFWGFGASVVNLDRRGTVRELLKIMLRE